jgi:TetR/AcrR family tetracycline transcriptional repressor
MAGAREPESGRARANTRAELSTEAILEVATRISEQEGFEAISMRRLAEEFGVTAMALYGYVPTKHRLLELIADQYLTELDLAPRVRSWDRRLQRIFNSFHELMVSRPILAHVLVEQTVDAPATYRMADVVLGILREHGFKDDQAVEIFSVLGSYTVGFTMSQRVREPSPPEAAERLERLRAQPDYPNLSAVAEQYLKWPHSKAFEHGLEHLINAYAGARP